MSCSFFHKIFLDSLSEASYAFYRQGIQLSSSDAGYDLDLSNWDLPGISSIPLGFATNGLLDGQTSRLPNWGG